MGLLRKRITISTINILLFSCAVLFSPRAKVQGVPSLNAATRAKKVSSARFSVSAAPSQANWIDIKESALTLVTDGRPVFLGIIPDEPRSQEDLLPYTVTFSPTRPSGSANVYVAILRDSQYCVATFYNSAVMPNFDDFSLKLPLSMNTMDSPPAGEHTYSLRVHMQDGKMEIKGARFVAIKL
jgi:hypothetical protein